MCGFIGFVGTLNSTITSRWKEASRLQSHRGPDYNGEYIGDHNGFKLLFSFQRLKIIDLSSRANQPMFSKDNHSIIMFNGEIYNFIEIKNELENKGLKFFSNSDTEVLMRSIEFWGMKKACSKFNGMWAFIYFDKKTNKIALSRDRFGKKPLYYFLNSDGLYFSSEAKSILTMINKKFKLNYQVLGEYLFQGHTNSSNSYFLEGIKQVEPNSIKEFSMSSNIQERNNLSYWSFPKIAYENYSLKDNVQEIRELFFDSVKLRLRSDVPVGILLSGGIDSSSIATVTSKISQNDLILFSAVDSGSKSDESPYIDKMSKFLNVKVNKVSLSLDDYNILELLENLIWINDQPLPSLSNLTHYLLTKKASDHGYKVLLTGQGADELICGYRKYLLFYFQYLAKRMKPLKAIKVLNSFYQNGTIINQINLLEAKPYISFFSKSGIIQDAGNHFKNFKRLNLGMNKSQSIYERQIKDFTSLSLPQLLHTEDRMSMANSTEMRVPFLDYRLVNAILPLKTDLKLSNGWTKYIFRKAMEPYLPKKITWRKDKQNFGNAQGEILKNTLKRPIIDQYLSKNSLIFEKKIFNRKSLMQTFEKYSNQRKNKGLISYREAFSPVSLEIWLRKYESFID